MNRNVSRCNDLFAGQGRSQFAFSNTGEGITELLQFCTERELIGELRTALGVRAPDEQPAAMRAVRDLVYELAAATNRDLVVDVLIHATGLAEFDCLSLRDYARKHALSPEGFRQQVIAMQTRLNLPRRPMQRADAN